MRQLRLLTWNIWMMPGWTHQSPANVKRAAAIAAELARLDFDILCLEKAFDGEAREVIEAALMPLGYRAHGPANLEPGIKINSGVWVLSRLTLSDPHQIEFRDTLGIESFARKGALLLTGVVDFQRFRLITTHLQGDDGPAFDQAKQDVRDRQVIQIRRELIDPFVPVDTPLIIAGDFCTPRFSEAGGMQESAGFVHIVETLRVHTGEGMRITLDDRRAVNDLADSDSGRQAELDYIFVHAGDALVQGTWERIVLRRGWDGPGGRQDLSYRYAVGATIRFDAP
jgi:endonuclease/exonuclease/phosphatase family metal-dependent hydrolase